MMTFTFKYFYNHFNQLIISFLALVSATALAAATTSPVEGYQPNGLIPVCVSAHYSACGLWDRAGKWRVEPRYHEIYENGSMWTVKLDSGRVGLLDAEGNVLIEPTFGEIGPFNEGLAYAQRVGGRDERYGFIDIHGHWVIEPTFMYSASFKDGLALVWIPGEKPDRDFEDRYMALVDKTGKIRKLPFADADSQEVLDGRYVVYRQVQYGNGEPSDMGVADKTGKLIVPWVRAQSIALIQQGGWMVQEAAPSKATVVYARNGREVFRVSGEEAHIYYFEPQSIAVFTQDGHHEGLVNLAIGKVLIQPKDVNLGEVSNGLVSFSHYRKGDKAEKWGYMDLTGHVVMPPSLAYGPAFESDVVISCNSEGKKVCNVINRDLRRVDAFDQYQASIIWPYAWETGPQSEALRDVMTVLVEGNVRDNDQVNSSRILTNQAGELILRITKEGECGREVARTADNKAVWPHHPDYSCAVVSLSNPPPANSPAPLLAAYEELHAFERNKTIERAKMVSQGGGIENLMPSTKYAIAQFQQLPWIEGPAEVILTGGEAKLSLPVGYRFISAQARNQVLAKNQLLATSGTINAVETLSMQADMIAGPDFRWMLEVVAVQRGYVDLSQGLPPAQDLLKTMKAYQGGDPSKKSASENMDNFMRKWALEPQLDTKRQRLAYAYSGIGLVQHEEFNLVRFGRQAQLIFMTEWTSMFTTNDFEIYQQEITQLVDAVEFLPKRAYADYQKGDIRAPYNLLSQMITGVPSEEYTEYSNKIGNAIRGYEEKKQAKINGLLMKLGFVILILIVLFASRVNDRKEKNQKA